MPLSYVMRLEALATFLRDLKETIREKKGFQIEVMYLGSDVWEPIGSDGPWYTEYRYRIVPNTRVVYINQYDIYDVIYPTLQEATQHQSKYCIRTGEFTETKVVWKPDETTEED